MSDTFDPALATKIAGQFLVGDSPLANPTLDQVRSAASQLRAAVAEVESLTRDNAILVAQRDAWQANADRIALERRSEEMAAIHDRDRLAAENQRLRSGTCSGVIPSTHIACGEGGNYCSEACRLAARVKELDALVHQACDWLEARTDKHARIFHAAHIRKEIGE